MGKLKLENFHGIRNGTGDDSKSLHSFVSYEADGNCQKCVQKIYEDIIHLNDPLKRAVWVDVDDVWENQIYRGPLERYKDKVKISFFTTSQLQVLLMLWKVRLKVIFLSAIDPPWVGVEEDSRNKILYGTWLRMMM